MGQIMPTLPPLPKDPEQRKAWLKAEAKWHRENPRPEVTGNDSGIGFGGFLIGLLFGGAAD